MPAIVSLNSTETKELLGTLSTLLPSKTEAVTVGLSLSKNRLCLTLNAGYVASYNKEVSSSDEWEVTFMYQDMYQYLSSDSEITIECSDFGVTIQSEETESVFPVAYSTVSKQMYDNYTFGSVPDSAVEAIKPVLKLNLERLYKSTYPVYVKSGIAIVKYPSMYTQARVNVPFNNILLSLNHWALLDRFNPAEYSQTNPQCLVVRRGAWTVTLPCTESVQENNFSDLLTDMKSVFKLNLHEHAESVRVVSRARGIDNVNLAFYSSGLYMSASSGNILTKLRYGNTSGVIEGTASLPIQVWLSMLSVLGDTTAELLLGGGKLCLRTHAIAILIRVVS